MTSNTYRIIHIDDDPLIRQTVAHELQQAGHEVISCEYPAQAEQLISSHHPHCVLTDLMMPGMDGMGLLKKLRDNPDYNDIRIIVLSSKSFDYDKNRAESFGADGYCLKSQPTDEIRAAIETILQSRVEITLWGTRGTLPVPGAHTIQHGGNTACVAMHLGKDHYFLFDAGTGLKAFSNSIMQNGNAPKKMKLFITHPHWDHINAFPFFVPLYVPGFEIDVYGAAHGDVDIKELLSNQMDGVYFPVNIKKFGAHVNFNNLHEGSYEIDHIRVKTMLLNHPGNCLGYRIEYNNQVICYVTDNELYPEESEFRDTRYEKQLRDFIHEADCLIADCCYNDESYLKKINWGHSRPKEVSELAHHANVKELHLFHHDPDQDDRAIDAKCQQAAKHLERLNSNTRVYPGSEGTTITL